MKPIKVAIRLRPRLEGHIVDEKDYFSKVTGNLSKTYLTPDYMFGIYSDQDEIFEVSVKPLLQYALSGKDVTFIAFGPQHSGKSYTMFGPGLHCTCSETKYGIIPRTVRHIFAQLAGKPSMVEYTVGIRVIEIINGQIKGLIDEDDICIQESPTAEPFRVYYCENVASAMNYLKFAMMCRYQSCGTSGIPSNPWHCITTLFISEIWPCTDGQKKKISYKINMVDLGSVEVHYMDVDVLSSTKVGVGRAAMSELALYPLTQAVSPIDPLLFTFLKNIFNITIPTVVYCCLSPTEINFSDMIEYLVVVDQLKFLANEYIKAGWFAESAIPEQTAPSNNVNIRNVIQLVDDNALHQASLLLNSQYLNQDEETTQQYNFNQNLNNIEDLIEEDGFGLEFAAAQMNKLVSNAEGLFHTLLWKNELSDDVRQQIDDWINLKQEYESCMSSRSNSVCERSRVGLEKIEEVTESDDKNCSSYSDSSYMVSSINSEVLSEISEGTDNVEEKKDESVLVPNINHKLDKLMCSLHDKFDRIFEMRFSRIDSDLSKVSSSSFPSTQDKYDRSRRRKSILPGELPVGLNDLLQNIPHCPPSEVSDVASSAVLSDRIDIEMSDSSVGDDTANNELKVLLLGKECKQNQLELVNIDVEGMYKRMKELQHTIEIKEQFIYEMLKNSPIRTSAKASIERKHNHLESEYFKVRTNLSLAERALLESRSVMQEQKVDKYRDLAMQYERKLHNIALINQLACESAKTVLELESSLQTSKRKMQKLKKQMKKDKDHMSTLETEISEDQKKMTELEEKHKSPSKIILSEEKKHPGVDLDITLRLQEDLNQDKHEVVKFEDRIVSKNLLRVGVHINHSEQVINKKSSSLCTDLDVEMKEAISHEIRNLRRTRDCLDEQRHILVSKFNKEKVLSVAEERKFLECDEAIEAIDATIEFKNGLVCGTVNENTSDQKEELMLLARLAKLSMGEMRSLLCKYFCKVIDLRESGRKMEVQIAELDQTTEAQQLKIQSLLNALQEARLESERKMVIVQREHQDKLHLLYRHFADDVAAPLHKPSHKPWREIETDLDDFTGACSVDAKPPSSVNIPPPLLDRTSGNKCRTTKVTLHGNKLVIQQHKPKKSSK